MSNEAMGYGYIDDEGAIDSQGGLNFGLNQNVFMTKFEYIKNAGKDGAEQEAMDIVFNVNGVDKSYRRFPITKAFKKTERGQPQEETTDPKSPEMQEAFKDFNACTTHIMHCFVSDEDYKVAISIPITSFEQFCKILMGLLPQDYNKKPLHLFAAYQWQLSGENTKTYLEIPKKMKYGRWLSPVVPALNIDGTPGEWAENRKVNPQDNDAQALTYTDGAGNIHPFVRNGWFVNSNFANQQKEDNPAGGYAPNLAMQPPGSTIAPVKGW